MEKPNITPTPWVIFPKESELRIYCDDSLGSMIADCEAIYNPMPVEQRKTNAQAIVTAVNCTYGANINPEKIQEIISLLEHAEEALVLLTKDKGVIFKPLKVDIRKALNNIKYKD